MSLYAKTVKEPPTKVLERARNYFGPGGLGLDAREAGPDCAEFSGGGGHVAVSVCPKDGQTEVELETREWDFQAREFLEQL